MDLTLQTNDYSLQVTDSPALHITTLVKSSAIKSLAVGGDLCKSRRQAASFCSHV